MPPLPWRTVIVQASTDKALILYSWLQSLSCPPTDCNQGDRSRQWRNAVGNGFSVYLPGEPEEDFWHEAFPASLKLIEDAIDHALQSDHQLKIDAPNTTVINIAEKANTTLVHLINYDAKLSAQDMAVELREPEGKSLGQVTVMSPDFSSRTAERIEATEAAGRVSFVVPHLRLYNLVVARMEVSCTLTCPRRR